MQDGNIKPGKKVFMSSIQRSVAQPAAENQLTEVVAKVPQVTFLFWVVKILATTLGETDGDAVTMS